jgi:hypothetical protein
MLFSKVRNHSGRKVMLAKRLRNPVLGFGLVIFSFVVGSERGVVTAVSMNALARPLARQGTAAGMAVVVNGGTVGGISLIDPVTETAMGPFLSGLLGPATNLLDCVVTPDGNTAIIPLDCGMRNADCGLKTRFLTQSEIRNPKSAIGKSRRRTWR